MSVQAPRNGAEAATFVSSSEPTTADHDEDRSAAQVQARDRRRVADPSAEPIGLLVEGVEAHQQEQRRDGDR